MTKVKTKRPKAENNQSEQKGKTICTDELIAKIKRLILIGCYVETSCAACGISKETYYDWLKKAARFPDEFPQYVKFSDAIHSAAAEAEASDVLKVERAAGGAKATYDKDGNLLTEEIKPDWRAAAWKLERRHAGKWSQRQVIAVDSEIPNELDKFKHMTESELEDRAADLFKKIQKAKSDDNEPSGTP